MSSDPRLAVRVGGVDLRNPILLASGTCGYGMDMAEVLDLKKVGGFLTKGISVEPRGGNPPPRVVETPSGMLNAIGLQNVGVDAFISDKLPGIRKLPLKCIANVYGNTFDDYVTLAEMLGDLDGVDAIELNLSCPNVKQGGVEFGQDPEVLGRLVATVLKKSRCPVWVKLSPNVADVRPFVQASEEAGADAVTLINTLRGMEINIHKRLPVLGNVSGGLSGPAIRPVALYQVYRAAEVAKGDVIGMGGIETWEDVVRFVLAGAKAVEVGTALFRTPSAPEAMVSGLSQYLEQTGDASILDLVNQARV
jgi:dihydroorotate dehydrogenase (NAD+) catalytic subunit